MNYLVVYGCFGGVFLLLVSLFDTVVAYKRDRYVFTVFDNILAKESALQRKRAELALRAKERGISAASPFLDALIDKAAGYANDTSTMPWGVQLLLFMGSLLAWPVIVIVYFALAAQGKTMWHTFLEKWKRDQLEEAQNLKNVEHALEVLERSACDGEK